MPREDVPYPGRDNCSIRCKLKEIWDALQGKLHSVNGLTGNGSENVNIVSTTPQTLSVNNNPSLQQVELAVDLQSPTIAGDLTVDGDLIANGDIIQNGSAYETHAQKVYSVDDYIVTRDGAVGPLAAGDYSGFEITKYDGTNNGRLVVDREGTARVGDVGDEQALATRDESSDLTDGDLVKWDATNLKLIDAGVKPEDLGLQFVAEISDTKLVTYPNERSTTSISLPAGVSFKDGFDYLIMMSTAPSNADVGVRLVNDIALDDDTSFFIYFNSGESEFDYKANIYKMAASDPTQIKLYMAAPSRMETQEKLVSGTNIKTINNTSILGSGDITIAAGGLTWTQRTANDDWRDIITSSGGVVTANKHVYIHLNEPASYGVVDAYIPKGAQFYNSIRLPLIFAQPETAGDNYRTGGYLAIDGNRLYGYNSFKGELIKITLTTDGATVTATKSITSSYILKQYFTVYIAD